MSEPQFLRTIPVLPVRDIAEAAAWYESALGFQTVYLHEGEHDGEATNYAILRREQVEVHLILDEPPPHEQAWTKAGTGYLYLMVRNVDEAHSEVRRRGAEVRRGLQTENWGARGFNLADPSGNLVQLEEAR